MSTYIDSIFVFILCVLACPSFRPDPIHITGILFLITIYCFELLCSSDKQRAYLGITVLILCFFFPEMSIFLPWHCYVLFLHRQYISSGLYLLPVISYSYRISGEPILFLMLITAISFYLAHTNRMRAGLTEQIHILRDDSVERELTLQEANRQILENQNDQIYIATLRERNRIAREIHDNVGHILSRSILQTGALLAICRDETLTPHLSALKDTLNLAMDNIRNSVHDLRDESIDLKSALQDITDSFTFCPVLLQCNISRHISKNVKYCFLAVTKEALNNIMKHSNATKVLITVREHPAFYQLLIEDNGNSAKPFPDFHGISSDGMGIPNMRDRVEALHGILHISREHGFRIFISIPKS